MRLRGATYHQPTESREDAGALLMRHMVGVYAQRWALVRATAVLRGLSPRNPENDRCVSNPMIIHAGRKATAAALQALDEIRSLEAKMYCCSSNAAVGDAEIGQAARRDL
jgi:hypothetical protein